MELVHYANNCVTVDLSATQKVMLDISNLVRYWNAKNTFTSDILDNFNQGTAYAPWVRIPVNGKPKYVNPIRLKEYISRETSSIPKHLIFGPMDRANGRFSYQTGRAKFASVDSKTFRQIFEKNDKALTKRWFVAVNDNQTGSNSQVLVSYKGKHYQVNKKVLKMNQNAIGAEIRDKDNYSGSLSISDDCISKIYNARSTFNANWFVLPSNRRVKPNWPVYMNKNQRMYLDVDQFGLYNIGKINDPQFGATLETCTEKVQLLRNDTKQGLRMKLRRLKNYILGNNYLEVAGKNWLMDRDRLLEYAAAPKMRDLLFTKVPKPNDILNAKIPKGEIFVVGPEGNLWKLNTAEIQSAFTNQANQSIQSAFTNQANQSTLLASESQDATKMTLYRALANGQTIQLGDKANYVINETGLQTVTTITDLKTFVTDNSLMTDSSLSSDSSWVHFSYAQVTYYTKKSRVQECVTSGTASCRTLNKIVFPRINPNNSSRQDFKQYFTQNFVWNMWKTRPQLFELLIAFKQDTAYYPDQTYPITFENGNVYYDYGIMKRLLDKGLWDYTVFDQYFDAGDNVTTAKPIEWNYTDAKGQVRAGVLYSQQLGQLRKLDTYKFNGCLRTGKVEKSWVPIKVDGKDVWVESGCIQNLARGNGGYLEGTGKDFKDLGIVIGKGKGQAKLKRASLASDH